MRRVVMGVLFENLKKNMDDEQQNSSTETLILRDKYATQAYMILN